MKTFIVDSFTKEPFKGNPAAVCLLDKQLEDNTMLKIAAEFGFSETAFILKTNAPLTYSIRFFSPKIEIPLCGHATLASAKVLFSQSDDTQIHFITSEKLDLLVNKNGEEIIMEFPVYTTSTETANTLMLEALGITECLQVSYSEKNKIIMIEIQNPETLASLSPDFPLLVTSYSGINGVLVTAQSQKSDYDYHYRYFWPWAGTNEDPVTGGVQTFLAPYWSEKLHKTKMKAFQSSERTGYMNVEVLKEKVLISSQAVIILEGNLLI